MSSTTTRGNEDSRTVGARGACRLLPRGLVLLLLAAASCGGTVVIGERLEDQEDEPDEPPYGTAGAPGHAGSGGSQPSGPPNVPAGGTGGWDAGSSSDAPVAGGGGAPSWSVTLNPGPDPGQAGAPHMDMRIKSLTTGADGAVILAGEVTGEASSSLPCFGSTQGADGVVLTYTAAGALDICQPVQSVADDGVSGACVDSTGATSFAGRIGASASIGSFSLSNNGEDDVAVGRIASHGQPLWARSFGYEGVQEAHSIAAGKDDHLYVAGGFEGTILSGADVLIGVGSRSAFVLKLDAQGDWLWGRSWGMGWAVAVDVAPMPSGGVVVAGMFDGPLELGDAQYVGAGAQDGFLLRLDADGTPVWSSVFGNAQPQRPFDLATGPAGEIALVGRSSGALDLGEGAEDPGTEGYFVVVYDAQGTYRWSVQLSVGTDDDVVKSKPAVAFNESGDVIVAGGFRGQVDFGQGPLSSTGQTDVFIAAWSSTGSPLWSHHYGDSEAQAATALSYRAGVGLTVAGTFAGTIDFGQQVLEASPYGPSAFLVRFP